MSKPRGDPSCGTSSEDALIPTERHPAYRQREARSGFGTERENLAGDAKGKGARGAHREAESTMRRRGADCLVVATKVLKWGRSEGGGSSPLIWANWFAGRRSSFS